MDSDHGRMDVCGGHSRPPFALSDIWTSTRNAWVIEYRLPAFPAPDEQSISEARSECPDGGRRFESAAAGLWFNRASATFVHGLCRLFGCFCFRCGGINFRTAGRDLGPVDKALD